MTSREPDEVDLEATDDGHAVLVRMVGENKRVLQLGAASGSLTRDLQRQGCKVTAIETELAAVADLGVMADETVVGDLNDPATLASVTGTFDTVVCADVLAQVVVPSQVLRAAVDKLEPGGALVISIRNVGHADVRLALLQGRFEYQSSGLLDDRQLRFFTYETFLDLLTYAGLRVVEIERIAAPVFSTELGVSPDAVTDDVLAAVVGVPESETYRFVVTAVRDRHDRRLRRHSDDLLLVARQRVEEEAGAARQAILDRLDLAGHEQRARLATLQSAGDALATEAGALRNELDTVRAELHAARAETAAAEAHADRARAERDAAADDVVATSAELFATRRELLAACIDESKWVALRDETQRLARQLDACRAAAGDDDELRPLDEVVEALRRDAESGEEARSSLADIHASRAYALIARYRRVLDEVAPPDSRRRLAYRLVTGRPPN